MFRGKFFPAVLCFLLFPGTYAQDQINADTLSQGRKGKVIASVATGTLVSTAVPYLLFIGDSAKTSFHFFNDNKGFLQVDKFLHAHQSYVSASLWYKGFRSAGLVKNNALLLGTLMGFVTLTPKEFFDGFDPVTGFSWGDLMANMAGPVFFTGQELLFSDQIVRYKLSYNRSEYATQANGFLGRNFLMSYFKDYNGHTYWLSMGVKRILPESHLPEWLCLSIGYSANGMFGIFENMESYYGVQIPETIRYRQYLLSLDLDWSKIKVRSRFLRIIFDGINYFKIPFPAIEFNSTGKFRGYLLYF